MECQLGRRRGIKVNVTFAIVNPELSRSACQSGGHGESGSESSLQPEANEFSGTGHSPATFIFLFLGKYCFQGPRQPSCGYISMSVISSVNGDQFKLGLLFLVQWEQLGWLGQFTAYSEDD